MSTKSIERNKNTFKESDIIFVSDFFADEYVGGAELTTEALFKTSSKKAYKLKSTELNESHIASGMQKVWVFFNFAQLNPNAIPHIVSQLNYFIVEYDYKFCKYRSVELHKTSEGKNCDCHTQASGKFISAFFAGAEKVFWMANAQKERYQNVFPFISDEKSVLLSSVFDIDDLEYIDRLRNARKNNEVEKEYVVLDSNSWIKGTTQTKEYLDKQGIEHVSLSGLSYSDMLRELSKYQGLAFMPLGGDTCPRIVIEAKLLGLTLITNENVQHQSEDWWSKSIDDIESYILGGHNRFWSVIDGFYSREVKLSGYTTTYNVVKSDYPWKESIKSMLNFCDEVVVLDGGSTDDTWKLLQEMAKNEDKLVIKQFKRNWDDPKFAIFDGQQKSIARTICKHEWCWQMDVDEVVHEDDYHKIKNLIRNIPKAIKIVSLPIYDYWGKNGRIRVDVNPWKWRLSRNDPHIAHGIKSDHIAYDADGDMYSLGSDGCDYIDIASFKAVEHTSFYTKDMHELRLLALDKKANALQEYSKIIENVNSQLPGVHHYSWFDLKRKIYTYKNYWSKHWSSLFKRKVEDTPENNMFFNKSWSEVTDSEISKLANKMEKELGGWIFHSKINFEKPTPWIKINRPEPKLAKEWTQKRGNK